MAETTGRFENRIIDVEIEFEEGQTLTYGMPLDIKISGSKTILSAQNSCTISIANLNREHRDYLLSNCNQVNRRNYEVKRVTVYAGREGVGKWKVFRGDIVSVNVTQPPEPTIIIRALTNATDKTKWTAISRGGAFTIGALAADIAGLMGLALRIDSSVDQSQVIPSWTFNGPVEALPIRLQELSKTRVFVDDDTLVMVARNKSLTETAVDINKYSGMVGIPEFTEYGVKVETLADRNVVLGGGMRLKSEQVQSMNDDYVITRIDYDLTTWEQAFYYTVWAYRSGPAPDQPQGRVNVGAPTPV